MPDILAINPTRRKRRTAGKKSTKRRKKKASSRGKEYVMRYRRRAVRPVTRRRKRRKPRRNPSRSRRYARSTTSFLGREVGTVVRDIVPILGGMLAGAYVAKRFSDEGQGGLSGAWTWKSYLLAIGGGWVAGMIAGLITGKKAKMRQHGLLGGCLLAAYIAIVKEGGTRSQTLSSWFAGQGGYGSYGLYPGKRVMMPGGEMYEYDDAGNPVLMSGMGESLTERALPTYMHGIEEETLGSIHEETLGSMGEYDPYAAAYLPGGVAW